MKKLAAALYITIAVCASFGQPPAPVTDRSARIEHLMNVHILGVEQLHPPGWSIKAMPLSAVRGPNDSLIGQVHIYLKGAPAGTLFEQQTMAVGDDQPKTELAGISVGADGILMCPGRLPTQCGDAGDPDNPIEFTFQSIKGEPIRFLFASDAGTIGLVVVPYPVAAEEKTCTLSAVRLTPDFSVALLTGVGFPPNIDVHYSAKSDPGNLHSIRSNAIGVIRFSVVPRIKPGQISGTESITMVEKPCSAKVTYEWGRS
jgi:hypothetical protein